MAVLKITIPDELHQKVQTHLNTFGQEMATFTEQAFEQFIAGEDPSIHKLLSEKTAAAMKEIKAGLGTDALQAMREVARDKNLGFGR